MVCNPNNPTGSRLDRSDEMHAVVAAAERVGAWILADEIYRGAEVDGTDVVRPRSGVATDKVVVTSGLSKAFAMPGLRIGWVLAPPKIIDDTTASARLHHAHAGDALRSAHGGRDATRVRENIFARTRGIIRSNLPQLEEWMHANMATCSPTSVRSRARSRTRRYDLPVDHVRWWSGCARNRASCWCPERCSGCKKGIRFGFGYDIEHTMKGLAQAEDLLTGRDT